MALGFRESRFAILRLNLGPKAVLSAGLYRIDGEDAS
jgi:hypothetical protein